MKYILPIIIALSICCNGKKRSETNSVSSDSTKSDQEPATRLIEEKKLSVPDLFEATEHVELVAYPLMKNLGKSMRGGLIEDGQFMAADVKERINLTKAQTNVLLAILSRPKTPADSLSSADCYNPQHAIVFYQNKKATAFLELCFSCHGEKHTNEIDFGILGQEKYCLLEQFFIASKINYGIEKEEYEFECGELLGLK